ncbi:zinc transport system ATP-binding protein [Desulfotomaculum arcticum]|uniref:Zinc transport system ATP-binding protein n=1 Tax=Desulfotruncus arcticus DSM 17038 TaxID=1121424 RepID=A0A1I2TVE5_9FIRM|nr:metal ABC transporter ATP-binding protein [Desulfotruncus arcticus]SFG68850.1 zinc transport system ATP-binding protein [Desulfotomaculum arcticum] [Desulfotruncus arcticus DSM 17038]
MPTDPVVEFEHVDAFLQNRCVLEDITFTIKEGDFIGVIGPNGAGKTTLLRLILGLLQPTRGQIKLFGADPAALKRPNRKVGYLPQKSGFDRRFPLSVKDVVLLGFFGETGLFKSPGQLEKSRAEEVMQRLGIAEHKDRPVGEVSGGQQQLAFLAAALVSKPKLLILDEPTNGLDPAAQNRFYGLVREMQAYLSLTVITVSHDLATISANADNIICINRTMHMHGSSAEVMKHLSGNHLYRCEFDLLSGSSNGWREQS